MRNINEALLLGNVGQDPDIRATDFGRVATFSLATSRKWTVETGETKEKTAWHRVVAFNASHGAQLADLVESYVRRGVRLLVRGSIEYKQWEKDGEKRYSTEIHAREIILLERGQGADDAR